MSPTRAGASRVDSILERAAREAKASGNKTETVALLEQIYSHQSGRSPRLRPALARPCAKTNNSRARQVLYPFTEGKNAYPDAVMELAMVQLSWASIKRAELTAQPWNWTRNSGRAYLALGTATLRRSKLSW